ncbi:hypothetical protein CVM73_23420 [Bradyrhizobium forestalis]|uniref:Uncharacterized protein n=1 Tax=Bradyrhizobium forestalis TaxID=1419263 RepID=A0A2M8R4S1_9BRAD|nr:hypothetical protein [Bradyrhizobium forestalis]PJG52817.1 hypothetical protein CVM73_23420 [Bradyrhizobium forestalis]
MRLQCHLHLLAAALIAAFGATAAFVIPLGVQIEEPINISVVTQALNLTMFTYTVAAAHAVPLGLPLFLFVRRRRSHVGIAACALGGFVVGTMPFGVLAFLSMIGGGNPTLINDAPPPFGWIEYVRTTGLAGLLGLVGGLVFWVAMRFFGSSRQSWTVVSAAALLSCGVFILPVAVRDRTCHNLFRDGRTSVGPQVYANLKVPPEDWKKLEQTFVDFGQAQALSIRRDEQTRDGRIMWRSVDLCNEAGVNVSVGDEPWLARTHLPRANEGMTLSIYSLKPDADWKPLARRFLSEIETVWPEKTTFRGPSGQILSFEDAMKGRP